MEAHNFKVPKTKEKKTDQSLVVKENNPIVVSHSSHALTHRTLSCSDVLDIERRKRKNNESDSLAVIPYKDNNALTPLRIYPTGNSKVIVNNYYSHTPFIPEKKIEFNNEPPIEKIKLKKRRCTCIGFPQILFVALASFLSFSSYTELALLKHFFTYLVKLGVIGQSIFYIDAPMVLSLATYLAVWGLLFATILAMFCQLVRALGFNDKY